MNQKLKTLSLLLIITLVGAVLRCYRFTDTPPALNWDEVSHGYNAYSILKTGADEWGIKLPLIFRAFGDYKLPAYIYLTVLPVWLFGLSAFSVRLISVLAGILAIPGIYLLARQLFKNSRIGLLSAGLLAILPWHFFISRPALEANLGLTLFIFGLYFLLKSISSPPKLGGDQRGGINLIPAVIFLGLTLHTYNTYRVITPLVVIGLFFIYKFSPSKLTRYHLLSLLVSLIFIFPIIMQVVTGTGLARYSKLSLLSDNIVYQIGQNRLKSQLPSPLPRLIFNRPVYFATTFLENYFSYFSPFFLYQASGVQNQFALPGMNMLTLPIQLLALSGLFFCLRRWSQSPYRVPVFLLLSAPIAAALTVDPPQALRPTPMIIPLVIMAAICLSEIYRFTESRVNPKYKNLVPYLLSVYLVVVLSIATGRYVYRYFTSYRVNYSSSWQYGYQDIYQYVAQHQKEYDRIFITKKYGEPHEFYAFYTQLDPKIMQSSEQTIRFQQSDWYWTDRIGNVYFVNDWQIPNGEKVSSLTLESKQTISTARSLLVTSPDHLPENTVPLKTIDFLNGELAFVIAAIK